LISATKFSACVAISAGGALAGGIAGWEMGPLNLELGRSAFALLGSVGGALFGLIGCYGASERVQATVERRRQLRTVNRLIALAIGGNGRTSSKDFLPEERLAAVHAIGQMGPDAKRAVPVLLDVVRVSALDLNEHQALFLASVSALVKVGIVDEQVITTLQAIRRGEGVHPLQSAETAHVVADSALRLLGFSEPAVDRRPAFAAASVS
jgi:hypothetical protein